MQSLSGVRPPIDTANAFVVGPLKTMQSADAALADVVGRTPRVAAEVVDGYATALADDKATALRLPLRATTARARDDRRIDLDGAERSARRRCGRRERVLQPELTPAILFLGDGTYFEDLATRAAPHGRPMGDDERNGQLPGPVVALAVLPLLQIEPFASASQRRPRHRPDHGIADPPSAHCSPFIPGLRTLPRWIPIHRLIWRDYYARQTPADRLWGLPRPGEAHEETPSCRSQERVSVAPTGVDPVTFRFSVERSTN